MSSPHIEFSRQLVSGFNWKKAVLAVGFILVAIVVGKYVPLPNVADAQIHDARICVSLFILAALFWFTEIIPPFATSISILALCVFLLGHPELGKSPGNLSSVYLGKLSNTSVMLFLGGLVLAQAATKHGFDIRLARAFITPFGSNPKLVLLGIIVTTAVFSMFMSNTATTAMMLAIVTPVLAQVGDRPKLRKAMILAVPFAANVGGMGTIIGTPPNVIAVGGLSNRGINIEFFDWMLFAVPVVIVLLAALWLTLIILLRPESEDIKLKFPDTLRVTPDLVIVVITFVATVLLWLTKGVPARWNMSFFIDKLHMSFLPTELGLPFFWETGEPIHNLGAGLVAIIPVAVFAAFGIITSADLKKLDWDVLALVAGGLALGEGVKRTGLADVIGAAQIDALSPVLLIFCMAVVTIVMSNFMSNTACAAMLLPLAMNMPGLPVHISAITVAFAASLAMSLPISTPPNALAYATRQVTSRDLKIYGTIISIIGIGLTLILVQCLPDTWVPKPLRTEEAGTTTQPAAVQPAPPQETASPTTTK